MDSSINFITTLESFVFDEFFSEIKITLTFHCSTTYLGKYGAHRNVVKIEFHRVCSVNKVNRAKSVPQRTSGRSGDGERPSA